MKLTIEETGLRYLKIAKWVGRKYFKLFTVDFPEDWEQVAAMAALVAENAARDAVQRTIAQVYRESVKEYGYRLDRDACRYTRRNMGSWAFDVKGKTKPQDIGQRCQSPNCDRAGGNRHPELGWVCADHIKRKMKRVECAECGNTVMVRDRKQLEKCRRFCSRSCRSRFYYRLKYGEQIRAQIAMQAVM